MSQYEIKLLKHAILQQQETGNVEIKLQPQNMDEIGYFTDAVSSLAEKGLIIPLSDNIHSDTISIVPNETLIVFSLTDAGKSEASRL